MFSVRLLILFKLNRMQINLIIVEIKLILYWFLSESLFIYKIKPDSKRLESPSFGEFIHRKNHSISYFLSHLQRAANWLLAPIYKALIIILSLLTFLMSFFIVI